MKFVFLLVLSTVILCYAEEESYMIDAGCAIGILLGSPCTLDLHMIATDQVYTLVGTEGCVDKKSVCSYIENLTTDKVLEVVISAYYINKPDQYFIMRNPNLIEPVAVKLTRDCLVSPPSNYLSTLSSTAIWTVVVIVFFVLVVVAIFVLKRL